LFLQWLTARMRVFTNGQRSLWHSAGMNASSNHLSLDDLPAALRAQLARAAAAAGRSVEAELIERLQASFAGSEDAPPPDTPAAPARRMMQFRDKSGQIIEVPADFDF
jgi:plasmid stability protein